MRDPPLLDRGESARWRIGGRCSGGAREDRSAQPRREGRHVFAGVGQRRTEEWQQRHQLREPLLPALLLAHVVGSRRGGRVGSGAALKHGER